MAKGQAGGRLAGLLADVLADTLSKHKAVSLPVEKAAQARLVGALLEDAERTYAPALAEMLAALVDAEELPAELRAALGQLTAPTHQWQAILGALGLVGFAFGAVSAAGQPWLRAIEQAANRHDQNAKLTPEQLAAGFVRGVVGGPQGIAEAADWGLNQARFSILTALAGNPPGTQELLEAYRRGVISEQRLEHGIQQGDLRNEWQDVIKALRFAPLDPSVVVAAAVQNQASIAEARRRAAVAGMDRDDFDLAFRVAGSPPGVVESIELWQRGKFTEADVRQVIAESRVKTKYTDALLELKRRLLPADTIASMVGRGVLAEREGLAKLMEHGYTHQDAAAWIAKATGDGAQDTRDLAKGEVLALYGAQAISRADATDLLTTIGYAPDQAELLLELTDSKRLRAYRDAAAARVHSLYVAFRIDRGDAAGALDALGMPASQVREFIKVWDLERKANTKDLTKAEIAAAYGRGIFSLAQAQARLEGIGYRGVDAAVILAEHAPPEARDRALSAAQVVAAVKRGQLPPNEGRARLETLGYSRGDADLLLGGIE